MPSRGTFEKSTAVEIEVLVVQVMGNVPCLLKAFLPPWHPVAKNTDSIVVYPYTEYKSNPVEYLCTAVANNQP